MAPSPVGSAAPAPASGAWRIPVTILGGSDRRAAELPAPGLHPLASYKGVAVRVGGRPLIAWLVERLLASRGFGPVAIAGPRRVYEPLGLPAALVDTDGSVADNLDAALAHHGAAHAGPIAVLASDVLPETAELDLLRERLERDRPCSLWCPFVRVPSDAAALGAFGWKPTYTMVEPGGARVPILPGHLCVFEPADLRLGLLHRLLDLAYETRNRSVAHRRTVMLRRVLLSLLGRDLLELVRLRAPSWTARVAGSGLRLARRLREGAIALEELELLIARIFLRAKPRPGSFRFPIVDVTSLAKDVDTEEEAREVSAAPPAAGR